MAASDYEVLDERFNRLIVVPAQVEKLFTGCRWAEGPAYFAAGRQSLADGGILVFAMAPVYWLVLIGALLVGLCVVSARTTLAAMTQALVSDAQRGRVESAMVTVIGIGTMGALIMAGVLGDIVGPKSVFMLTGVVVLLAGIASIFTLRGAEERLLNNLEP